MLLEDERNVVNWVSQYGALPKALLEKLLYGKSRRVVQKILRNLVQGNYLQETGNGAYLAMTKNTVSDAKTISALWVLSCFGEQVAPYAHYPVSPPAQLFFLKGGVGYEIIVINRYEEYLARLIQPQKNTKYLIVLPDISMVEALQLPDAPYSFATFRPGEEPEIQFYEMRETP